MTQPLPPRNSKQRYLHPLKPSVVRCVSKRTYSDSFSKKIRNPGKLEKRGKRVFYLFANQRYKTSLRKGKRPGLSFIIHIIHNAIRYSEQDTAERRRAFDRLNRQIPASTVTVKTKPAKCCNPQSYKHSDYTT